MEAPHRGKFDGFKLYKSNLFDRDIDEKDKICSHGEKLLQLSGLILTSSNFKKLWIFKNLMQDGIRKLFQVNSISQVETLYWRV